MGKAGRLPAGQVTTLREKIKSLFLSGVPVSDIAKAVELSPDTVRKHVSVIRKEWAKDGIDTTETRLELIQKIGMIGKFAAAGAAKSRGDSMEIAYLRLQLDVFERIAKLTGANMPEQKEININQNVEMSVVNNELAELSPSELATRLKGWASALEEEQIERDTASDDYKKELSANTQGLPRVATEESTGQ